MVFSKFIGKTWQSKDNINSYFDLDREQCLNICIDTFGCKAVTYYANQSGCHLKVNGTKKEKLKAATGDFYQMEIFSTCKRF